MPIIVHGQSQRGEGGTGGPDCPPPPPWKITKYRLFWQYWSRTSVKPSQLSVLDHHWPASKTPFKWRFAGGPMMAHFYWYLDSLSLIIWKDFMLKLNWAWKKFITLGQCVWTFRVDMVTVIWLFFRKRGFRRKLVVSTENGRAFQTQDTTIESIKETSMLLSTPGPAGGRQCLGWGPVIKYYF